MEIWLLEWVTIWFWGFGDEGALSGIMEEEPTYVGEDALGSLAKVLAWEYEEEAIYK